MIIYSEYFFLENFIAGIIFFYTAEKIVGKDGRRKKERTVASRLQLIASGILSGLYSFTVFLPLPFWGKAGGVILFSMIQGRLLASGRVKNKLNIRKWSGCSFIYFAVSVFYGGMTGALLNLWRTEGLAGAGAGAGGNGAIYAQPLTYIRLITAASAAAGAVYITVKILGRKRLERKTKVVASVSFDRKTWELEGLIDTGNHLREPVSGKPVALVSSQLMEEMRAHMEGEEERFVVVPYVSVGERGLLAGYRADCLKVEDRTIEKPVIAVSRQSIGDIQILLPGELMERGIYGNY